MMDTICFMLLQMGPKSANRNHDGFDIMNPGTITPRDHVGTADDAVRNQTMANYEFDLSCQIKKQSLSGHVGSDPY